MPESLADIGRKWGTDKVDHEHCWFNKNYMETYEQYFHSLRDKPIRFLEIGILHGRSLRTWREYFPNAEIHGVDINPACKQVESKSEGIFVHILDCSEEDKLENFAKMYEGYFDVILDDGSHINNITLKTFKHFYNCLKPVSYYIIEDLLCCYVGDNLPNVLKHWPGTERITNKETTNDPQDMLDFYSQIHKAVDLPFEEQKYNIEYIHHYTAIVLLKRNDHYRKQT
jgi:hypothetical protein